MRLRAFSCVPKPDSGRGSPRVGTLGAAEPPGIVKVTLHDLHVACLPAEAIWAP